MQKDEKWTKINFDKSLPDKLENEFSPINYRFFIPTKPDKVLKKIIKGRRKRKGDTVPTMDKIMGWLGIIAFIGLGICLLLILFSSGGM